MQINHYHAIQWCIYCMHSDTGDNVLPGTNHVSGMVFTNYATITYNYNWDKLYANLYDCNLVLLTPLPVHGYVAEAGCYSKNCKI